MAKISQYIDKDVKTNLELEKSVCDITERFYEKNLSTDEIKADLEYEKEVLLHDIENKNYINESHKVEMERKIKKIDGELSIYQKNENNFTSNFKKAIDKGGLVVGKVDREVKDWHTKKLFGKIPYKTFTKRKVEDIYYVKDDMHSLTIGATRSRKN